MDFRAETLIRKMIAFFRILCIFSRIIWRSESLRFVNRSAVQALVVVSGREVAGRCWCENVRNEFLYLEALFGAHYITVALLKSATKNDSYKKPCSSIGGA